MTRRIPLLLALLVAAASALLLRGPALAGPDGTVVPEVVDLTAEQATSLLSTAGFKVARTDVDGDPAGTVASQSPGGFMRAAAGSTVTLAVRRGSAGAGPVPPAPPSPPPSPPPAPPGPNPTPTAPSGAGTVPSVIGRTEAEASAALSLTWRVRVLSIQGSEANDGRVVDQVPAAGTPFEKGSEVTITVARRAVDPATAVVPSVVGLDGEIAARQLSGLSLVPLVTQVASDPTNAGKVVSQDPAPGTVVAKGSNVALSVGQPTGPSPLMDTEVPDCLRISEADARARLFQAGLQVVARDRLAPAGQAGLVLEQDPPAGSRLARGRAVTIVVGRLLMLPIRVPEVLGLDGAAAGKALRDAGFAVEETTAVSLPGSAGKVIAEDPPGGSTAIRGSTVRVTIGRLPPSAPSNAPSNPTVPNVLGRTEVEARADLAAAGLSVRVAPTRGDPQTWGRVVRQSPPAGAALPRGAEVVIEVPQPEAAPAPFVLPNYTGTDVTSAQADLASRGLVAAIVATEGSPDGRVLGQNPVPGTPVSAGTTVTLTVARVTPLGQVVLYEPAQKTSVPRAYGGTFRWSSVPGAEDYQLEILALKDGAWVPADNEILGDTTKRPSKFKKGTFQWHVRARRDKGRIVGPWSEWRQITWY